MTTPQAVGLRLVDALRDHGGLPLVLLAGGPRGSLREKLVREATGDKTLKKRQFYKGSAHPEFLPCSVAGPVLLFDGGAFWSHHLSMSSVEGHLGPLVDVCHRSSAMILEEDGAEETKSLATLARICGVERTVPAPVDWNEFLDLMKGAGRAAPAGPLCSASLKTTWYGLKSGTYAMQLGMPPRGVKVGDRIEVYEGAQVRKGEVREIAEDRLIVSTSISKVDAVLGVAAPDSALVAQQVHATWLGGAKPQRGELFSLGRRWGPCDVSASGGRYVLSCPRMFLARRSGLVMLLADDGAKPAKVSFLKLP